MLLGRMITTLLPIYFVYSGVIWRVPLPSDRVCTSTLIKVLKHVRDLYQTTHTLWCYRVRVGVSWSLALILWYASPTTSHLLEGHDLCGALEPQVRLRFTSPIL